MLLPKMVSHGRRRRPEVCVVGVTLLKMLRLRLRLLLRVEVVVKLLLLLLLLLLLERNPLLHRARSRQWTAVRAMS